MIRFSNEHFVLLQLILMFIIRNVFVSWNIFILQLVIREVSASFDEVQAMTYLARYGYLNLSIDEIQLGTRVSAEAMFKALQEFQDFNNLDITGNLDTQTVNKMQQPRCGFPDKFSADSRKRRFVHSTRKWSTDTITYVFERYSKHVPVDIARSEVHRAFKVWQEFIPIKFEPDNEGKPNILVSFETGKHQDEEPFDGPRGVLAHAIGPQHPYSKMKTFIHFDDDESWQAETEDYQLGKSYDDPNIFQVAIHEVGHTLGLLHSKDQSSVMRAHYPGNYQIDFKLSFDDVYAVQTMYPKRRTFTLPNGRPLYTTVPPRPVKTIEK